ncbi:MAG: 16S rRNA (cytidine(1402)-2'-O)-methyltransferase [Bacilli bacterium]|nr:16S rRNA (cytidine(1402)-2'-O)-methyltransferase [Bacilli bacterium]MBN2696475.1 16S rRNA (cytidine(1402)-2'-O)-methyltransferase [Bacilli bacterium]
MKRHKNYHNDLSTLYLIPTPIGNLEDITLRALRILKEVGVLFAEDTRVTQKLLGHFKIKTRIESLHEHNEAQASTSVLDYLEKGMDVGLVSDAGMPLVSDPGFLLVQQVQQAGYNVVSLPGPSAVLSALAMSGIATHPFVFMGFADSRQKKRREEFEKLLYRTETIVFYETPHRIKQFLQDLETVMPTRKLAIIREISKNHEETIQGLASELMELEDIKGEIVVVIEGYKQTTEKVLPTDLLDQINHFCDTGLTLSESMKKIAELTGVPKNVIYQEYLAKTKKQ